MKNARLTAAPTHLPAAAAPLHQAGSHKPAFSVEVKLNRDLSRVPARRDRFEQEADRVGERLQRIELPEATRQAPADGILPLPVRARIERELPYDLSSVRIRTDRSAQFAAQRSRATAVTQGREIAFAAGAYDPTTRAGRMLLGHELAHTAQQGAVPSRAATPGLSVSRSPIGVAQRTPGVDAADSWQELIASEEVTPNSQDRQTREAEAKRRFLTLPEGARLINSLWRLAHSAGNRLRFRVRMHFVDEVPQRGTNDPAAGRFEPDDPAASAYDVWVKNVMPPQTGSHVLPGGVSDTGISFSYGDPESEMATTIHHELLHVEWVRSGRQGTGH